MRDSDSNGDSRRSFSGETPSQRQAPLNQTIETLLERDDDTTVSIYGDAALEALQEQGSDGNPAELRRLLDATPPLTTVDVGALRERATMTPTGMTDPTGGGDKLRAVVATNDQLVFIDD
ncbi:hypothetical protein [Natronomonas sp. EA1]|uniref:hypothetical protein n=1 Tax=Natronomonas sp. EA1 TaxID=3421655 RepID=UPI003EB84293